MSTKLTKVPTYSERLPSSRSYDTLITWPTWSQLTVPEIYIFTITRVMASRPGRVLTYASSFSTQTLKSPPTSCNIWYYVVFLCWSFIFFRCARVTMPSKLTIVGLTFPSNLLEWADLCYKKHLNSLQNLTKYFLKKDLIFHRKFKLFLDHFAQAGLPYVYTSKFSP